MPTIASVQTIFDEYMLEVADGTYGTESAPLSTFFLEISNLGWDGDP
jgi:hypothetical protein